MNPRSVSSLSAEEAKCEMISNGGWSRGLTATRTKLESEIMRFAGWGGEVIDQFLIPWPAVLAECPLVHLSFLQENLAAAYATELETPEMVFGTVVHGFHD